MKYSRWIGILASIVLIIACFMPWTYHPDIQKTFNGFFSENNLYVKPGKVLIFFSVIAITFFAIQKLWAKRWNLLICSLNVAFAIKSFILFSGCYKGICPDKKMGLWLVLITATIMLLAASLPDMPVKKESET